MSDLQKLASAQVLGTQAFKEGKMRVPAHDAELIKLIEGNQVGNPMTLKLLSAWTANWDLANLNNNA
ncbi:hypothetical protein [Leeuwenhoekiella sp. MAR_2009_132]|uniref:hypothetical protein n=1 Tax=Leeuwenhoekiella sp. MAR_2009_132 TaxID=1392489 RepID=UPI000F67F21A|nr:hypothetical protein [Leeuwenhoekiella sp. MAR_2009_132]